MTIPTNRPTLRCPHCRGKRIVLSDVRVGVEAGMPVWRRARVTCEKCSGRGFLEFQPVARGVARVPQ